VGHLADIDPVSLFLRTENCPISACVTGANVIGIARPSGKWAGLLEAARLSSGTFTYPISDGSEGVDAMKAAPELANWLTSLYPEKQARPIAPPCDLNHHCSWPTMLMNIVSNLDMVCLALWSIGS
jgi:hypothetical protein